MIPEHGLYLWISSEQFSQHPRCPRTPPPPLYITGQEQAERSDGPKLQGAGGRKDGEDAGTRDACPCRLSALPQFLWAKVAGRALARVD